MSPVQTRHPHSYTLDLLQIAIDRLPPSFPAARKKSYLKRLEKYRRDTAAPYDDIRETIAELGKESWAMRKAYDAMYDRYGRASEEAHLLENLDEGVRAKYESFLHEGGKIAHIATAKNADDIRGPSPFERYFDPEEKFAISQALVESHVAAREEIDALVTDTKKDEYSKLVKEFKVRQRLIEFKLEELRMLSAVSSKWRPDIQDRLRSMEEGWSLVELDLDLPMLERETEHWRGTLQSFLHRQ
jgi:hypothetical protein